MISSKGYWIGTESKSQHAFDPLLCKGIVNFFKQQHCQSVIDFGCGMGKYVEELNKHDIDAYGVDGNPNTPELTNSKCGVLDLSVKQDIGKYDWVMSLEVGEHLPKEYEDIFISNLHNHNTKGVLLSWAIKGQGGHGHYNEQNNDYIKKKFEDLGYTNDVEAEQRLRQNCSLRWFRNTIMVFHKPTL